jgi:hypothetical protein
MDEVKEFFERAGIIRIDMMTGFYMHKINFFKKIFYLFR